MPFSPVSFAYGEIVSAAKLAQMVENIRSHDHAQTVSGSGQGVTIGLKASAGGRVTGVAAGGLAADARTTFNVGLPASRFTNAAQMAAFASSESAVLGGRRVTVTAISTTTITIELAAGTTAIAAGAGIAVQWIAVQSLA